MMTRKKYEPGQAICREVKDLNDEPRLEWGLIYKRDDHETYSYYTVVAMMPNGNLDIVGFYDHDKKSKGCLNYAISDEFGPRVATELFYVDEATTKALCLLDSISYKVFGEED